VLNKDVLTQAEVLIALRMTGPRDVAAIDEWVRLHADEDEARDVKSSLASLPVGTAWVWSPGWLDLLRRVQIRLPRTFDSSATPRPGQKRLSAKAMAPIDLAALGAQITATVERAKAEDPRQLRRTIDDLQRQLADRPPPAPAPTVTVTVPVLDAECLTELRGAVAAYESSTEALRAVLGTISAKCVDVGPDPVPARSENVLTERAEESVRVSFDEHMRIGEAMVSFEGESFPAAAVITCPQCSTSYHEDDTMGYDDATGEVGCPGCAAKTEAAMSVLYVAERRAGGTMPTAQEMSTRHADGLHSGRFNRGCPDCETQLFGQY